MQILKDKILDMLGEQGKSEQIDQALGGSVPGL